MTTKIEVHYPLHYICAPECRYRRGTVLITDAGEIFIISSVGDHRGDGKAQEIGYKRYWETFVFTGKKLPCGCYSISEAAELDGISKGYPEQPTSCFYQEIEAAHDEMVRSWENPEYRAEVARETFARGIDWKESAE